MEVSASLRPQPKEPQRSSVFHAHISLFLTNVEEKENQGQEQDLGKVGLDVGCDGQFDRNDCLIVVGLPDLLVLVLQLGVPS